MSAKRWVPVRLEEAVYLDLVKIRDSLERARVLGHTDLPGADGPLSLSMMVARLIRHVRNDRRRMREAAARARARAASAKKKEGKQ